MRPSTRIAVSNTAVSQPEHHAKANITSHIHFICQRRHRQIRLENRDRGYVSIHSVVFVFPSIIS